MSAVLIAVGTVIVVVLIGLSMSLRVVKQYQEGVLSASVGWSG